MKYQEQAKKFLRDTNTEFTIEYQCTRPYFSGDKKKRAVYRFCLKNPKGEYCSTFGESLANSKKRGTRQFKKPSAYDILACLEKSPPGTFENFLSDMGYNDQPLSEYPNVLKVWKACVEQYRGISQLFTDEEMEALREIS